MKLKIHYLGGIEDKSQGISLTGSSTLFSLQRNWNEIFNILVDAWSFQGSKNIEQLDRINPIDPKKLDVIIATHAHLDHIGRIPYLVRNGFDWDIYMTELTKRLAYENWLDSVSIKEQDLHRLKDWKKRMGNRLRSALKIVEQVWILENNKYLTKREREKIQKCLKAAKIDLKKAKTLLAKYWIQSQSDIKKLLEKRKSIQLLFDREDVERTLRLIKTINLNEEVDLLKNLVKFKPYNTGHIEWSIGVLLKFLSWNKQTSYNCFIAQDLGRLKDNPLNEKVQKPSERINYLQIEQTYAGRKHEKLSESIEKFVDEIKHHTWPILIPAFSIQRAQFILGLILQNYNNLNKPKIYIDSKLIQKVNDIFSHELPEKYAYLHSKLIKPVQPNTPKDKVVSKNAILISSSWMAQGGSIEKWLKYYLQNVNAKIIFTGYQAEGTNWRKILNWEDIIIGWEKIKNLCEHSYISWFSSHADDTDLKNFIKQLKKWEKFMVSLTHWGDNRYKFKEDLINILQSKYTRKKSKKKWQKIVYNKDKGKENKIVVPNKGDIIEINI